VTLTSYIKGSPYTKRSRIYLSQKRKYIEERLQTTSSLTPLPFEMEEDRNIFAVPDEITDFLSFNDVSFEQTSPTYNYETIVDGDDFFQDTEDLLTYFDPIHFPEFILYCVCFVPIFLTNSMKPISFNSYDFITSNGHRISGNVSKDDLLDELVEDDYELDSGFDDGYDLDFDFQLDFFGPKIPRTQVHSQLSEYTTLHPTTRRRVVTRKPLESFIIDVLYPILSKTKLTFWGLILSATPDTIRSPFAYLRSKNYGVGQRSKRPNTVYSFIYILFH